jgi:phage terminase large subunit
LNDITIPNNWKPRKYQKDAYNAWIFDKCKHLELIWHRRAGKDSLCLNGTMVKAWQRPANYWHMLPQANQVRKAIWKAVNSHTGQRWIDEAFPVELRRKTNDNEMYIEFINGSTWQCIGSDNYQSAIGSAPAGIVFSEWSLSNPSASGYLRPILRENNGWQLKIGTPRGKNHAYKTYKAGLNDPNIFAQLLTVKDTGLDRIWSMDYEKQQYINEYGNDLGNAMFLQEYYCSFESAIFGSIWGGELSKLQAEGRFTKVEHDPAHPVFTAWDIGRQDATAIWFFQVIDNQVRVIDYLEDTLKNPDYFASQVLGKKITIDLINDEIVVKKGSNIEGLEHRRQYRYQRHFLPHDAKAKTLIAKGKSMQQQMNAAFGWEYVAITPNLSIQDGIKAGRKLLSNVLIDERCEQGFEALKQYKYAWNDEKQCFSIQPVHDWTSHPADAFRYMAIAYKTERIKPVKKKPDPNKAGITLDMTQQRRQKTW